MSDNDIDIEKKLEIELKRISAEISIRQEQYLKTIKFLSADAPISILCLPKTIETILSNSGYFRIYDLFDVDLTKIKGLGAIRSKQLTSSLDQFFSMMG